MNTHQVILKVSLFIFMSMWIFFGEKVEAQVKYSLDQILWQSYSLNNDDWLDDDKENFEYDVNGNVLSVHSYIWISIGGIWSPTEPKTQDYTEGILTALIKSKYENGIWQDTLKKVFYYHNDLLDSMIVFERRSNDEAWNYTLRERYIYNEQSLLSILIAEEWDDAYKTWTNVSQNTYEYDDQGRIVKYYGAVWDFLFEEWMNYDKEEYTYTSDPISEEYLYYLWDESTNQWTNYFKDFWQYYNDNMNKGYLSYYWDDGSSDWVNFTKEIYAYNTNGAITEYVEYEWNMNTERWDYYDKETYEYDSQDNLMEFIDYDKDGYWNKWIPNSKEEYTYDKSITLDELILPYDEKEILDSYFKTQLKSSVVSSWNADQGAWILLDRGLFSYSMSALSDINIEHASNKISIYPNPTQYRFTILSDKEQTYSVNIFEMNGKWLRNEMIDAGNYIDVSNLKNGVYIIEVYADQGEKEIKKLLKH